jgi:hypothetical protein
VFRRRNAGSPHIGVPATASRFAGTGRSRNRKMSRDRTATKQPEPAMVRPRFLIIADDK